ncbi:MAG: hypothetical protein M9933_15235 [Chitinophagaceae bacterium]|nr:hypothetical protein [Chitinophagaceae bacterium]
MKRIAAILLGLCFLALTTITVSAQCSICTKTAQQMGEKPAKGLNAGILYLMTIPYAVIGFVGYRLWKQNQRKEDKEQ